MAKRAGQLAGLAALGALGYMLSKDKEGAAPVESRAFSPNVPTPAAVKDAGDDYPDESRRGRMTSPPDTITAPARVATPVAPRNVGTGSGRGGQGGPAAGEEAAYRASRMGTGSGRGGQGGPTAAELAAYRASQAAPRPTASQPYNPPPMTPEMRRQAEAQALERVTPEEYLIGGPSLKGVAALAKGLANRGTARAAESAAPYLKELPGPTRTAALPAPTARLTGPSAGALKESERAGRAAARQSEMLNENAARYGLDPNAPGYEAAMRALRENIGGGSFTVKKKGGAVKAKAAKSAKKMASGGMTASRRGDGIAMRGKTRGKLY